MEPQLLLFPYHAISPARGSQQTEHSKGPPGAPLLTTECGTPIKAAGGRKSPSSLVMTD